MSLQIWIATQLYIHFGVSLLCPLHTQNLGSHVHVSIAFNYQFQYILMQGAYKTYKVPKLPKLGTKNPICTFFVPILFVPHGLHDLPIGSFNTISRSMCALSVVHMQEPLNRDNILFSWCYQRAKDQLLRESRVKSQCIQCVSTFCSPSPMLET